MQDNNHINSMTNTQFEGKQILNNEIKFFNKN